MFDSIFFCKFAPRNVPAGCDFTAGNTSWTTNSYTVGQWAKMEAAGAVFLPTAGIHDAYFKEVRSFDRFGAYWSSTADHSNVLMAYYLNFLESTITPAAQSQREEGFAVRLVRDAD